MYGYSPEQYQQLSTAQQERARIKTNRRALRSDVTAALGQLHRAYSEYTMKAFDGVQTEQHKAAVEAALKAFTAAAGWNIEDVLPIIVNE